MLRKTEQNIVITLGKKLLSVIKIPSGKTTPNLPA